MTISEQIFKQLIIMLVIAVLGFIFAKLTKTGDKEEKFLTKVLLLFINPCLTMISFNVKFEKEMFFGLLLSLALSFFIIFLFTVLAKILFPKNKINFDLERLSTVFTNCGFVGIPLIKAVFGTGGVFYLMGFIAAFNVMLWTYGIIIIGGKIDIKKVLLNTNVLAVIVGLIVFCLPVKIPEIIANPVSMVGNCNTAVSMILLGIFFAHEFSGVREKLVGILWTCFVRLVICSVIALAVCFGVIYCLSQINGINMELVKMICTIVLIASMCPAAVSVSSFACLFDKDIMFGNLVVCFTHVLCVLSIPGFMMVFEFLLKC
ncbi:MAG: AEC family transporter [Treponema sp.]|nr:AEC family transporter [Candidatus Treponema scatequi]